jgi:hypothetical protein
MNGEVLELIGDLRPESGGQVQVVDLVHCTDCGFPDCAFDLRRNVTYMSTMDDQ